MFSIIHQSRSRDRKRFETMSVHQQRASINATLRRSIQELLQFDRQRTHGLYSILGRDTMRDDWLLYKLLCKRIIRVIFMFRNDNAFLDTLQNAHSRSIADYSKIIRRRFIAMIMFTVVIVY
jgi:hypothetical protein